jgi:ankyrin repeat protein
MAATLIERIAAGRTDLVLELLATGAPATAVDARGTALLQWCAYYGDVSALRHLLAHGESLQTLGDDLGLDAAAFHGHWQLCQYLLEHGAPVNGAPRASGEAPLHAALANDDRVRYDPVVRVLLAAGADANARTVPGVETGAFMRDCRTRGETPLHRAAAFGSEDTITLLLGAGAQIESVDAHGETPLAWASWYRRPPAVLRALCYAEHRVRPDYRSMRANLIGDPLC